jgi:lipid kinase YegS
MSIRIIINGKKVGIQNLRDAIEEVRSKYQMTIEVRVTYEYGDLHRLIKEAIDDAVQRVIIAGGDGTINEAIDALARYPKSDRVELAILPLGTANDFAVGCDIPTDIMKALHLSLVGSTTPVDIVKANDRYFINVATAGYGAEVTKETPIWLKNIFGGGSYLITGIMKLASLKPYRVEVKIPSKEFTSVGIIGAVCNGRQAGGGRVLAPKAYINDGLLDIFHVADITDADITILIDELNDPKPDGIYIKSFQTPWIETYSTHPAPLNLDGEPYERGNDMRYDIIPKAIELVLPSSCPCIL